jgi:hypothetical protein
VVLRWRNLNSETGQWWSYFSCGNSSPFPSGIEARSGGCLELNPSLNLDSVWESLGSFNLRP